MKNFKNCFLILSLIYVSHSCSSSREMKNGDLNKMWVEISVQQKVPYCGGAQPTEGMLNETKPVSDKFLLYHITSKSEEIIETDANGLVKLYLDTGQYILKEKYKNVTFEKFLEENNQTTNPNIRKGSEDCMKKWWQSNLLEFEVKKSSENILKKAAIINARCYVGINPCQYYTGPLPP